MALWNKPILLLHTIKPFSPPAVVIRYFQGDGAPNDWNIPVPPCYPHVVNQPEVLPYTDVTRQIEADHCNISRGR